MTTSRLCSVVAMAALLSGGLVVANETVAQAAPAPVAVYDSVGAVPGNVASVGFEATSTSEFGDRVQIGPGPRALVSVAVLTSSWACETGGWTGPIACSTTPGATFTHGRRRQGVDGIGVGLREVELARMLDTRPGEGSIVLMQVSPVPLAPGRILEVDVANLGGLVPSTGVSAVSLDVTATNVTAPGFITVYPCGQLPLVSSVNYDPSHLSTSNAVLVPVSSTGSVCFYSMAAVDLVVDINGWFAAV